MPKMQEGFVNINNIPTLITTFGRWITEKPEKNGSEDIILIIPANNGTTGFYRLFMRILHTKYHCPVWVVANSGHDVLPSNSGLRLPKKTLSLNEQTRQKVAFFEKYIPENAKVTLIGHSIGCHMALEMLKEPSIDKRVTQACLLFPLIEQLDSGKKGISMKKYEKYQPLLVFFAWLLYILPTIITTNLLKICKVPEKDIPFILVSCNPLILKQVLLVAKDEMELVIERDNETIKKNLHKIRMIYQKDDGWFPETCYDELKKDFPGIKAELSNFKHAFYLQSSAEVADIVTKWISEGNPRYY